MTFTVEATGREVLQRRPGRGCGAVAKCGPLVGGRHFGRTTHFATTGSLLCRRRVSTDILRCRVDGRRNAYGRSTYPPRSLANHMTSRSTGFPPILPGRSASLRSTSALHRLSEVQLESPLSSRAIRAHGGCGDWTSSPRWPTHLKGLGGEVQQRRRTDLSQFKVLA